MVSLYRKDIGTSNKYTLGGIVPRTTPEVFDHSILNTPVVTYSANAVGTAFNASDLEIK